MKSFSFLAVGLLSGALAAVTPDATCGGTNKYTCLGSTFGNCCSSAGWCGSTTAYCGTGCQSGFGNCGSSTPTASSAAGASSTKAAATPNATVATTATTCLKNKKVPYKVSNDAAYSQLVQPYNLRLPYKPAVIVQPTTNKHVQDAVVCGAKGGLKIQAKSGGHSYASFSSGGKDGSMMIDLQSFQTVVLDKTSGVVQVGGGVRLGNLADGIYTQGKRALSHGTCPGVGVGGHVTHGGYGTTSRSWGLAMDAITGADVVLANGTLVKASATQNSEIYWGVRGAAESLGIVTTFYLQTRAAPESVTYFGFSWEGIFNTKATFTNSFLRLQEIARNSSVIDNRISFGVYMDGYGTFSPSGVFMGTVDEFNTKIKPEFLRNMPAGGGATVKSYSWYDYLVLVSDKTSIKEPLTGYNEHDTFFAKSITVPEKDGLTSAFLNAFYDQQQSATTKGVEFFTIINLYGGPGSAINTKDTNFAAYNDRDSLWVFQNYGQGANTVSFMNGLQDAVIKAQPQTSFGAYLNYVDPSYDAATAHKLYYGDMVYTRLAALKKKVDPGNVFWNPQSIGA